MSKADIYGPREGLLSYVARGSLWVSVFKVLTKILGVIRLVVLVRFLLPEDFGVMGVALLTMGVLESFSKTGFIPALIQKKNCTESDLNTAWTTGIIRGLSLWLILFVSAPYAAVFFNSPQTRAIIQVIGFGFLLQSINNIGLVLLQRELRFDRLFIYEIGGLFAEFIFVVIFAFLLRNAWALVLGMLAGSVTRCVLSYAIHSYRPGLELNTDKVKQLWGFGKWLLGSSILLFFILQGDDLFVGKMLGITALGFYQVAYRIANLPTTEITHAISQVTYPAYSRLKEDKARLRQAFLKVFQITILFSFAAGGLLFVLAHDFTKIFLGKEWLPMVPAMQILIPAGIARSVMATTGPIFKAMGKPGIATKWQIVRLGILACLIYPFILKWQLVGVSLAVLLSNLLSTVGFCFSVLKILECRFKIFLKIITPPILLFAGMTAGMKLMNLTTYDIGIVEFSLLAVSQLCLVVVFVYLFEKFFDYNIKPLLTKAIGGIIGS